MTQHPRRVTLYTHPERNHTPRDVNALHRMEKGATFNTRLAVWLTEHVGTMTCAYIFFGIGIGSIIGVLTGNVLLAALCGYTSSYVLQLVLLPIIMVGQKTEGRKTELQADEMFKTSQQSFADIEGIIAHLNAQDTIMLQIIQHILKLSTTTNDEMDIIRQMLKDNTDLTSRILHEWQQYTQRRDVA